MKIWVVLLPFLLPQTTDVKAEDYCGGTPWSCVEISSGTRESCEGGPFHDIDTGCVWDTSQTIYCSGTPNPCESFDLAECTHQLGCRVTDDYWCDINVYDTSEYFCVKEGYPWDDFMVVYRDCPWTTGYYLDCASCDIFRADELSDIGAGAGQCNSCIICSNRISWDCSNLVQNNNCNVVNCAGNCVGGQSPTSSPTPPPTDPPTDHQPTNPPTGPRDDPGTLFPDDPERTDPPTSGNNGLYFTTEAIMVSLVSTVVVHYI